MPSQIEPDLVSLVARVRQPGMTALIAEAEAAWAERRDTSPHDPVAGPRPFEDAFPTFYQFSNRPR
jgi:hypothetical protein